MSILNSFSTATSTRSSPKDLIDLELESGPSKRICQAPDDDSSASGSDHEVEPDLSSHSSTPSGRVKQATRFSNDWIN